MPILKLQYQATLMAKSSKSPHTLCAPRRATPSTSLPIESFLYHYRQLTFVLIQTQKIETLQSKIISEGAFKHSIFALTWEKKDINGPMVIIEWLGISEFYRTFLKICGSLGDFCLDSPENFHCFQKVSLSKNTLFFCLSVCIKCS